jgi:hypothetical protein
MRCLLQRRSVTWSLAPIGGRFCVPVICAALVRRSSLSCRAWLGRASSFVSVRACTTGRRHEVVVARHGLRLGLRSVVVGPARLGSAPPACLD